MSRKNRSSYAWRSTPFAVYVVDLDLGGKSVTNDAEEVCRDLKRLGLLPGRHVVYRDSLHSWGELKTDLDGNFTSFGPLACIGDGRVKDEALQRACEGFWVATGKDWDRN